MEPTYQKLETTISATRMKIDFVTKDVAIPLATFIKAHWPPARLWHREALDRWVRWALSENFLVYVLDETRIAGVGIARPVMHPEDGRIHHEFDQEGPCLFVDLAIATNPLTLAILVAQMRQRFGMRQAVAYLRGPRERLVVLPMDAWHRRMVRPLLLAFPPTAV